MKKEKHSERASRLLKFLDRYIGIPIVYCLGLFHRKSTTIPSQIRKIAFLKTAGIGDTIILSAVIDDVKKSLPHAKITLVAGKNNYEVSELIKTIDDTVSLEIKNFIKCIREIRNLGEFDVWLDFGPWPRYNSIITFFAKARYKVGFKTKGQCRHYVYDKAVEHIDHVSDFHELYNYRNIVREIGVASDSLPHISLETPLTETIANQIAVHVYPGGSRSYLKEWPTKYWIQLLNWLTDNNCNVYLTGGIGDIERLEYIRREVKKPNLVFITAGKYSLKDTALLLRSSKLVISTDTGTMHMASALGCNLISLHGPTSPGRWGPLSKMAKPIKASCQCSPCIDLGFDSDCTDNKCMQLITPEMVIEKCKIVLGA